MAKRVTVLMGGFSAEREVSLNSGKAAVTALKQAGYAVTAIDVQRGAGALIADIEATKPDVVFNALHGRFGEDGRIQGMLDLMGVAYTHSGMMASALAMDKPVAKRLFADAGIPVPEGRIVSRAEAAVGDVLPRPFVLKPFNEGSSVGVHIVRAGDNGNPMADWSFGDQLMAERFIPGREITVAVMGERALGVTEITSDRGFYDYTAKYADGGSRHLLPAPMPKADYDEAMRLALLAHKTLGCRGVTRADMRYDDTAPGQPGKIYLLEINTQPGMTTTSLVPELAAYAGIDFPALVGWMVENARCDA